MQSVKIDSVCSTMTKNEHKKDKKHYMTFYAILLLGAWSVDLCVRMCILQSACCCLLV